MKLKTQKRISAQILKCSEKKVKFDPERLEEIKEAITKADIRGLIIDNVIRAERGKGPSRVRARKLQKQKSAGKRRGHGSRKGKQNARIPGKEVWMAKIRLQRKLLKDLVTKEAITTKTYRDLYRKAKGGFFRSVRHIRLYLKERGLYTKK